MTMMSRLMTGAGLLALSTGFAAAAPAIVQNDVNLRTGPGPDYDVIAAMPAGTAINVLGCQASWCQVAFGGTLGFASRGYLGIGGPVAAAPAYGSYAYGGSTPAYGERTFATERRFGEESAVRGERRLNEEGALRGDRRFGEESAMRGERRVSEEGAVRGGRRFGEQGAVRAESRTDNANARGSEARATEIKGANPMLNEKGTTGASARAEPRSSANETRGSARTRGAANARSGNANANASVSATTGAAPSAEKSEDHGPNFIGPGKANVDNHK